jgi:hypothetical protein
MNHELTELIRQVAELEADRRRLYAQQEAGGQVNGRLTDLEAALDEVWERIRQVKARARHEIPSPFELSRDAGRALQAQLNTRRWDYGAQGQRWLPS